MQAEISNRNRREQGTSGGSSTEPKQRGKRGEVREGWKGQQAEWLQEDVGQEVLTL